MSRFQTWKKTLAEILPRTRSKIGNVREDIREGFERDPHNREDFTWVIALSAVLAVFTVGLAAADIFERRDHGSTTLNIITNGFLILMLAGTGLSAHGACNTLSNARRVGRKERRMRALKAPKQ